MPIIALILTLSQGVVEIRSEGTFDTTADCMAHFQMRSFHRDFRRGDIAGACVPQEKMEGVIRALFGSPA